MVTATPQSACEHVCALGGGQANDQVCRIQRAVQDEEHPGQPLHESLLTRRRSRLRLDRTKKPSLTAANEMVRKEALMKHWATSMARVSTGLRDIPLRRTQSRYYNCTTFRVVRYES